MLVSQGIVLEGANQKEAFATRVITVPEFWKTPEFSLRPPKLARSFSYNEAFRIKTFTPEEFWASKSIDDYYEALTRSDIGNSPFYYLLIHEWMDLFGYSDYAARSLSVLFSVLIIALTYVFARRFFGEQTALISSAIVAFEPFFIAYSHQARNYSLTFFLTLLSTYFFLRIIENENAKKRELSLYAGYILVSGLSLLSHFLVISVFLAQGIYALLFLRQVKGWVRLSIAGVLALTGITWWMTMGGGVWTLSTLDYQAKLYKRMADTMPYNNPFGIILPATFPNVFIKSLPIFSDLYLLTNGLFEALEGKKNVIIALFIGVLLTLVHRFNHKINLPDWLRATIPSLLLAASWLIYNNHGIQFCILSLGIFLLSLVPEIHSSASVEQKKRLWLIYLMTSVPTLFLIVMSFKNGHTYGLTQRYSGFSFPYMIILVSLLIQYGAKINSGFKLPLIVLLSFQAYFVGLRLKEFYEDRSIKYGYFAEPRKPNPYYAAAQKIKEQYQPGDTIFYPAIPKEILSEMDRTYLNYSIVDAQMTNLYLPKDARYIQQMDTTQYDHIILKRKVQNDSLIIVTLKNLRQ